MDEALGFGMQYRVQTYGSRACGDKGLVLGGSSFETSDFAFPDEGLQFKDRGH